MNKGVTIILALIGFVAILSIAAIYMKPFETGKSKTVLSVGSQTFDVEIADSTSSRMQGLSGKNSLGEKEGLLFVFPSPGNYGFWMKDMNFPIDIVWINNSKVIGFSENLQPEPNKSVFALSVYYPPGSVDQVLEINAGAVAKYDLKIGDAVNLQN
ncbi:MAG: DUF192 domain-containing protein [Candidatus Liptonbacteria bacterium]|nr:DUF192 domain-containing protein [Candidatus Liptonbacteria bacterium]